MLFRSTAGTLTLSGAQTASNGLIVETGASVNLTGTWVGATTVAGTFGGTGTLTGDLTFSDGATFKVFATDDNGLAVSGTVTCPEEGTVAVDASALEDTGTFALLTASGLDADKFALAEGAPEGATLAVVNEVLTLTVPTPSVTITIPEVENATVAVTVDGVAVTPENGVVTAQVGATVVVTYTATDGYTIANGTIEFIAAADTTTVDTTDVTVTEYIAWIYDENGDQVGDPYTAVLTAVQTFLTTTTGESIRFKTSIEESYADFHAMLISACDYDDETFTYTRKPSVAKVTSGIHEYLYTSLVDAVTNAISGATVTLLADVDVSETGLTFPADETITLDLNNCTITAANTETGHVQVNGALTITDSSEGAAGKIVSGTSGTYGVVQVAEKDVTGASLTIAGGAIEAYFEDETDSKGQHPAYGVAVKGTGTTFTMTGGSIKAGYMALMGHGSKASAGTYNISGGTITSMSDFAAYFPTKGDCAVTISGGTFSGLGGVSARAGTVTITGGTFTATGNGAAPGSAPGTTGLGFMALAVTPNYGNVTVSVSGGTFTSATDVAAVMATTSTYTGTISLTGGTYSTDVSDYCATGYEATEDSGVWTVAALPNYTVTFDVDGDRKSVV